MSSRAQVSVYETNNSYLVHAYARTPDGILVATLPAQQIPKSAGLEALGAAIAAALYGLPEYPGKLQPSDFRAISKPVLDAFGVGSWRALYRRASHCQVSRDDLQFTVTPTRNGGDSGDDRGYHELGDAAAVAPTSCTNAELGAIVSKAFKRCT